MRRGQDFSALPGRLLVTYLHHGINNVLLAMCIFKAAEGRLFLQLLLKLRTNVRTRDGHLIAYVL